MQIAHRPLFLPPVFGFPQDAALDLAGSIRVELAFWFLVARRFQGGAENQCTGEQPYA